MLWNPSINLISKSYPTIDGFIYYGFGYDQVNDKYKLLVVKAFSHIPETIIYTFGENSFKNVKVKIFHIILVLVIVST